MGQNIAHGVDPAPLPAGAQNFADSSLDTLMGIGDHELDAAQNPAGQLAQEGGPHRFGFGGTDLKPQNFAPAVAVDADGDDDGDRDDASAARSTFR